MLWVVVSLVTTARGELAVQRVQDDATWVVGSAPERTWTTDVYQVTTRDYYVTASNPPAGGDHTTTAGTAEFGLNHDGVARLLLDTHPSTGIVSICTGSLLWSGQHILTAAHCLTDGAGEIDILDGLDGNSATFELNSGNVVVPFTTSGVTTHPSFNGDTHDGFDLAIISLTAPVQVSVPRYDIFRGPGTELGLPGVKVGYGRSGHGNTGEGPPDPPGIGAGTKRAGLNEWESLGVGGSPFSVPGFSNDQLSLMYDFDNGLTTNDAFGFFAGTSGPLGSTGNVAYDDPVGFGLEEVMAGGGDSGGPTFVDDGGGLVIAGVTSFGLSLAFSNGDSSDVISGPGSSFGEFAIDVRVASPEIANFIDGLVPEPSSGLLVTLAMCVVVANIRCRR